MVSLMRAFLKRHWPLVGLGVLLALVASYLLKSGKDLLEESGLKEIMAGEGLKLQDVHYTQDDPDKAVKWILDAKEVRFSGDRKTFSFNDFRLRVEPEDRPVLKLMGKRGDYQGDSGDIKLWGDLEGYSENGYKITTDHVLINEKDGSLRTDMPVKIVGPFFSVAGRGLFVDLKKKTLKILSDTVAIIDREAFIS